MPDRQRPDTTIDNARPPKTTDAAGADPSRLMVAGFTLVLSCTAIVLLGAWLGSLAGSTGAGLIVGVIVGFVVSFRIVFVMYARPLRQQMEQRDYSHLKSDWSDDD